MLSSEGVYGHPVFFSFRDLLQILAVVLRKLLLFRKFEMFGKFQRFVWDVWNLWEIWDVWEVYEVSNVWKVCLGFLGSLFGMFGKFRKFVWDALGGVNVAAGAAGGLSNSSLQPLKTPAAPHFILIAPHSLPSKFHFPQLIRCSSQFGCTRSLPPLRVQQRPGVDARECSSKAQPPSSIPGSLRALQQLLQQQPGACGEEAAVFGA